MRQGEPNPRYEVYFWVNEKGRKPVADWMKTLSIEDRKYLGGLLRDLAYDGPMARPKCFKNLDAQLWEIRDLRKGAGFRIYFGFDGKTICIVVNAGNKSSQTRDISLAKERLSQLED
jgi:putative addiction module killer protein